MPPNGHERAPPPSNHRRHGAGDPAADFRRSHVTPRGTTDTEYDYGRRVEQVVAAPGGVTRLSVGVIVPGATDLATQATHRGPGARRRGHQRVAR